jgi:23S rRNA pseudouridine1911/1915/1917 synthase
VQIDVDEQLAGQRLDKVLVARFEGMGRAAASRLFDEGRVLLVEPSGRRRKARKGELATPGSVLEVSISEADLDQRAAADDALEIVVLLETAALVVVDKAAGVPSAPLRPRERGTIANALVARYPEMAGVGFSPREPGLCHRLDTGTSGLLLAARSAAAFDALTQALAAGEIAKRYLLICGGALADEGTIELPLATGDRRRVIACAEPSEAARLGARPARTHYRVLRREGGRALVEASAPRAQRHQIRAHFAAIGAPLVGDELYGGEPVPGLERHALHASFLACASARGIASFEVSSPLPVELEALLQP